MYRKITITFIKYLNINEFHGSYFILETASSLNSVEIDTYLGNAS